MIIRRGEEEDIDENGKGGSMTPFFNLNRQECLFYLFFSVSQAFLPMG